VTKLLAARRLDPAERVLGNAHLSKDAVAAQAAAPAEEMDLVSRRVSPGVTNRYPTAPDAQGAIQASEPQGRWVGLPVALTNNTWAGKGTQLLCESHRGFG